MARYQKVDLVETRARFRRNRNPGAGVVQGVGELGTLQQVLWSPRYDTRRRATVFKRDTENRARLDTRVFSRRGNLLAEYIAMDSVATAGFARQIRRIRQLSHFVTTSTSGAEIAQALRDEAKLPQASLDPENDRHKTQGVSGLIVATEVAPHRVAGGKPLAGSFLLLHRPAVPHGDTQQVYHQAPEYNTLDDDNFEPGTGVGLHAYEGIGRQPFTGHSYAFPLGSSAENTLDMYHDLLGKRRGVNIAVKEIGGAVTTLVVANASGEDA